MRERSLAYPIPHFRSSILTEIEPTRVKENPDRKSFHEVVMYIKICIPFLHFFLGTVSTIYTSHSLTHINLFFSRYQKVLDQKTVTWTPRFRILDCDMFVFRFVCIYAFCYLIPFFSLSLSLHITHSLLFFLFSFLFF